MEQVRGDQTIDYLQLMWRIDDGIAETDYEGEMLEEASSEQSSDAKAGEAK